ncbi:DctP family TRAP transporter solute-binding subunit [Pannonibacter sp. Pt2-lr]
MVAASGHPKGDAATLLAKRVNEEMNGKACMQVFPNSQLFDDDKVMEALLLGDVQLAAPSLAKFEAYTLKYRLFDLPFLFQDLDAVERFTTSDAGKGLLNAMTDVGFVGLGYWSSGLKQFSANKPLLLPTDAAGLKFRIQTSDVAEAMIKAMGANAQKLAFKEVYGALQTGVVDGQENSWSNTYTQKFFEVQDGISETNHQLLAYLLVTSQEWLDSLEPDVREQFLKITDEVTAAANAAVAGEEAKNRQRILDAGATIRQLTPEQRQAWVEAMKPVWTQFEDDIGQDLIDAAVASNTKN